MAKQSAVIGRLRPSSTLRTQGRSLRDQGGAVVVEFALIVPMLLLVVFGVLDFGYMLNRSTVVSNASRDGARVASLGGTHADILGTITSELAAAGIPTSSPTTVIKIDCKKVDGTACNATSTSYDTQAESGATALVTVTYNYAYITPLISQIFGSTQSLVQPTQMRVE